MYVCLLSYLYPAVVNRATMCTRDIFPSNSSTLIHFNDIGSVK